MASRISRVFLAIGLVAALPGGLVGQELGTIAGTVTAAGTQSPIGGAGVFVVGTTRTATADARGQYTLRVAAGTYTVRARAIGYESAEQRVTVAAGETVTADFRLPAGAYIVDELVVVGARTARTATETPVPVDVISRAEIVEIGHPEVNQILATLAPAFHASHQTIADGTDHINPASLRGLGPDQVLVLVNGKRRHPSALVHVNGTFGRGTVGVDLNAIPAAAIERIEVLRDGASAQYGSDAIAGVINIVLKEQTDRIDVSTTVGSTPGGGGLGDLPDNHDGDQVKTDINYGFRIGDRGFLNFTGEYLDRGATSRAEPWAGDIFPGITGPAATDAELATRGLRREDFTMRVGQAAARVGLAWLNGGLHVSDDAQVYASGGYSFRDGEGAAFFRLPNSPTQMVPQIFPNGFLPEIHTKLIDRSVTAGVRGATRGWDIDFSLTRGENDLQYNIEHTVNASLGTASPTTFDAGQLISAQTTGNLDLVRPLAASGVKSLSLVAGAEFRVENYRIVAGEAASWQLGNGGTRPGIDYDTVPGARPKLPGSQGFPGFQPANEVNRYRTSLGVYGGLETQLTDRFLVDVGGRYELYSDFGSTFNYKVATRYEVVPTVAVRAAVSTGFRAPSLPQVWFNNVSTQFVVGPTGALVPSNVLTSHNASRITEAFGVPRLTEETSVNWSAGVTWRPRDDFSLTADAYRITIDGRIVITSQFRNDDPNATVATRVTQILTPFQNQGVTRAQFFTNAVDTKTTGFDVVAAHTRRVGAGTLNITASANLTETVVERVNLPPVMAGVFTGVNLDSVRARVLNREDENRLEDALPREKGSVAARYTHGRFSGLSRATHYGEIGYRNPTNPANDERFGAKTLVDLDLSYELGAGVRVAIGGNNIFNTYPDRQRKPANIDNGRFIYSRRVTQFGMNGGFYYARVHLTM